VMVVAQCPADKETEVGLPAQGPAGMELTDELEAAGMSRHRRRPSQRAIDELTPAQLSVIYGGVSVGNLVKCQPPGKATGAYGRLTSEWRTINQKLVKKGYAPLMHPAECCWPALLKNLLKHRHIVAVGGDALKVLTGTTAAIGAKKGSISRLRLSRSTYGVSSLGEKAEEAGSRLFNFASTFHPSYVLQSPGDRESVIADFAKFRRFFTGRLRWVEPGILFNPPVDAALDFLKAAGQERFVYRDWETDAKEPLIAKARCVSIGFPHAKKEVDCWACNDRHNGNPQKEAFIKQLRDAKGDAKFNPNATREDGRPVAPCVICDGSGRHTTDFSNLLLTFTSVSPTAHLDGRFYNVAEYRRLIEGINELYAKCASAKPEYDEDGLEALEAPAPILVGHNSNVYDRQVEEASPYREFHFYVDEADEEGVVNRVGLAFDIKVGWAEDTMLDARYVSPEARKGLAALGARFEDITVWKEDHEGNKTAVGSKNDWELGVYCCNDNTVCGRVHPKARAISREHGSHNPISAKLEGLLTQKTPYAVDVRSMMRHVGMHRVGFHVDQEKRAFFQKVLDTQAAWHLQQFNAIAGVDISLDDVRSEEDDYTTPDATIADVISGFVDSFSGSAVDSIAKMAEDGVNVNSGAKLRELIYKKWGIEKPAILSIDEFYTATGLESVGEHVLRAIQVDKRTPRQVIDAIYHLRMAKRKRWKLSVTTLAPLGRGIRDDVRWEDSEAWAAGIRPAGPKERGFIWPDGVVRASWSSRTAVWRDDCSEPNLMTIGSRKGGLRVQPASMEEMKKARAEKTKMDGTWLESLTHSAVARAASFDHTWTLLAKAHQSGDHETLESAYAFVGQLAMRHMQLKDGIFKAKMKSVFNAKRGMCLAGGDMDQMHLRIIANMYRIPVLLDAFENGLDPHNALAYAVFGDKFAKASGWGPDGFSLKRKPLGGDALQMREAMKTFRYAVIYGASPDTAWKVYVAVENDVGGLPFSGNWINENGKRVWKPLEKNEIRTYHAKWREAEPEWKTNFWDPCAAAYQANAALKAAQGGSFGIHAGAVGFLTEGLLGTRSGALEGGSPSATSNWEV